MKTALFLTILTGCTFDTKSVGFDTNDTSTSDTDKSTANSGCPALFDTAGGALDTDVIQCIESAFEENGYPFDAQPCNDLEGRGTWDPARRRSGRRARKRRASKTQIVTRS